MAVIPTYTQPSVSTSPLPDGTQKVTYTPEAFGSGVGKSLETLGNAVGHSKTLHVLDTLFNDPLERMQAEDDEAAVKRAGVNFGREYQSLMYDPETGFLSQKGEAAVKGYENLEEKLAELSEKHGESLTNKRQRDMFRQLSGSYLTAAMERARIHAREQRGVALDNVSDDRIKLALDEAALDPLSVSASVATIEREVEDKGNRHGWSPERKAETVRGYKSDIAVTRIGSFVDNDPLEAARLYKTARQANVLTEPHVRQLEGKLRYAAFAHIGETYARDLLEGRTPSDLVSIYRDYGVSV